MTESDVRAGGIVEEAQVSGDEAECTGKTGET